MKPPRLIHGSAKTLPLEDESVQCVVTSPPYWGLRQYAGEQREVWGGDADCAHVWTEQRGGEGYAAGQKRKWQHGATRSEEPEGWEKATDQGGFCICGAWYGALGLEPTPELYVAHMVEVFREVRRVLRKDGTLWLNLGDSYAASGRGGNPPESEHQKQATNRGSVLPAGFHERARQDGAIGRAWVGPPPGLKQKDLVGIPWMVAFALRADGWYLRSDIIWCLSASTRLYARTARSEGPMTIHDLVRLDPSTVQLWNGERWTRVRGWSSRRSETLRLSLRSGERIICSPNHRWPLADERVLDARDLAVGDVLATTRLPEPEETPGGITEDMAWFAGLYLAEGSHSDDAIQIAGHVDEVARHERVMQIAERYGGSAVLHAGPGNSVSVVVHSAILEGVLRHFIAGRTALDKHLHARAWRSSDTTLRAFMDGYLAGDGSYDASNYRWRLGFGNNAQLADAFRTLAARLGATLTLAPTLAQMGRTRTFEAYRGEWRWQASEHGNAKQRAEIIAIEQRSESEVWDIGVEDEPHLFALASGVLTHNSKPNPMPESVTDRPTKSHEYLFLLSKSARYFYDADAIREPQSDNTHARRKDGRRDVNEETAKVGNETHLGWVDSYVDVPGGRNARTVWTIATRPYHGAHFATYPEDLVGPCILAGSAAKACGVCGAPWERVTDIERDGASLANPQKLDVLATEGVIKGGTSGRRLGPDVRDSRSTTGWRPTCAHQDGSGASVVLDPFNGSGTTGRVAVRHGRSYIGVDISEEYLTEQALKRIDRVQHEMGL